MPLSDSYRPESWGWSNHLLAGTDGGALRGASPVLPKWREDGIKAMIQLQSPSSSQLFHTGPMTGMIRVCENTPCNRYLQGLPASPCLQSRFAMALPFCAQLGIVERVKAHLKWGGRRWGPAGGYKRWLGREQAVWWLCTKEQSRRWFPRTEVLPRIQVLLGWVGRGLLGRCCGSCCPAPGGLVLSKGFWKL